MKNKKRIKELQATVANLNQDLKLAWDAISELLDEKDLAEQDKEEEEAKSVQEVSEIEIDSLRVEITDRMNELTEAEFKIRDKLLQLEELDLELFDDAENLTRNRYYDIVQALANTRK